MIKYEKKESLIERQKKSEEAFLADFRKGEYVYDKPLVVLNPYLISPLTAMILFRTSTKQEVTLTVKGKSKEGDIVHRFPAETDHILPYTDYTEDMKIQWSCPCRAVKNQR